MWVGGGGKGKRYFWQRKSLRKIVVVENEYFGIMTKRLIYEGVE